MNNDKEQAEEYFKQKSINRRSRSLKKLIHLSVNPPQFHTTQVWRNPERSSFLNAAWTPKDVDPVVWEDYSVDCNSESGDDEQC